MKIRMKATGQVEDFDPAFARRAVESGMAESLEATPKDGQKSGMPVSLAPETAAVAPPETATVRQPLYRRILGAVAR